MRGRPTWPSAELHGVWLRRYPLRLGARASEHYESVYRELALLASSDEGPPVPGTLLELLEEMDRRSARNNASEQVRDEALARGEDSLDIELHVPADVVEVGPAGRAAARRGRRLLP